jgi:hypothetical protein
LPARRIRLDLARIQLDLTGSSQNGLDPAGYDRIQPLIQSDLAKMARYDRIRPLIWPDQAKMTGIWPDPAKHACRNPATVTGHPRIPATAAFSVFVIFSCEPNAEKYFRKNYFF